MAFTDVAEIEHALLAKKISLHSKTNCFLVSVVHCWSNIPKTDIFITVFGA